MLGFTLYSDPYSLISKLGTSLESPIVFLKTFSNPYYFSPMLIVLLIFLLLTTPKKRVSVFTLLLLAGIFLVGLFGFTNPRYYLTLVPIILVATFSSNKSKIIEKKIFLSALLLTSIPLFTRIPTIFNCNDVQGLIGIFPKGILKKLSTAAGPEKRVLLLSSPLFIFYNEKYFTEYTAYSIYGEPRRGVIVNEGVQNVFNWKVGDSKIGISHIEAIYSELTSKYKIKWIAIHANTHARYPEVMQLIERYGTLEMKETDFELYQIIN